MPHCMSSAVLRMLRLVESDANSDSRHRLKEDYVIKAPGNTNSAVRTFTRLLSFHWGHWSPTSQLPLSLPTLFGQIYACPLFAYWCLHDVHFLLPTFAIISPWWCKMASAKVDVMWCDCTSCCIGKDGQEVIVWFVGAYCWPISISYPYPLTSTATFQYCMKELSTSSTPIWTNYDVVVLDKKWSVIWSINDTSTEYRQQFILILVCLALSNVISCRVCIQSCLGYSKS